MNEDKEFKLHIKDKDYTFKFTPAKNLAKDKSEACKEYNLLPEELVESLVVYVVDQEVTNLDEKVKSNSRFSKYLGIFIGTLGAPVFLTASTGLVGTGLFALILGGVMAIPLWYIFDKTIDATLVFFKEKLEKSLEKPKTNGEKEDGNDKDRRDGEGTKTKEE